jgi:hypothetical protein
MQQERNASKIQTMNVNQTKQKNNFKFKTHQTLSLSIRKVRREKKLGLKGDSPSMMSRT